MQSFPEEVLKTVERRLAELHVDAKPLPVEELKVRFERQQLAGSSFHFEIGLDDTQFALSVTALDQQQADDYGPITAVSEEVGRLHGAGLFVAYHEVMVAPLGTILLDLVGPKQTSMAPTLQESAERFLQKLLDHDVIRPLLK